MKPKLTVERLTAAAAILFALVILFECRDMDLTANYSVGPAALPIICAVLLIFFAAMAWITSTDKVPATFASFATPNAKRAILLIVLTIAFILGMYFLGLWIPLLAFSVLSFHLIEKHPLVKSILMSAVWVVFLYVVFVLLLKMNIPLFV